MWKRFLLVLLVVFMIFGFGFAGCDGGGGGDGDDTTETDDSGDTGDDDDATAPQLNERAVYVNPDDSRLYSYVSEDGELFTYYGRRDEAGMPTVITMLEYGDTAGDLYLIYYNRKGMPAKVIAGDGTTLEFDYHLKEVEGAEIGVTAALPIARAMAIKEIDVTLTVPEDDGPAVTSAFVSLDEEFLVAPDPRIAEMLEKDLYGNIEIIIDKCGQPVRPDGEVWVNYQESGKTSHHPAFPMNDPGYYMSRIPREYFASPEDVKNTCKSFADALSTACSVFDPKVVGMPAYILMTNPGFQAAICGAVAVKMSAVGTPVLGSAAGAACGALLAGGTVTCNTLGKSIPGDDANYMDTFLCDPAEEMLEGLNAYIDIDKVTIQAFADFSNTQAPSLFSPGESRLGVYASQKLEVSVWNSYPDLEISATDPTIDDISTVPGAPNSGDEYTVTADLSCVSGLDLLITVTRDGAPIVRFEDASKKRISISVPGDPPGSVDAIVVSVREPITDYLLLKRRMTVELGEAPVVPGGELFEASVNIPGKSIFFNPINRSALITQWTIGQDAVGIVASEGASADSEFISITINPGVVDGPGTYALSSDEARAATFLFASPAVKHANVGPYGGTNVYFHATGGTFTITQWGTRIGDTVGGRFSARMAGTRITGEDSGGNITSENLVGEITGSFNLEIIRTSY